MSKEEKKMTRRYVRMTREEYEERTRNTELYFLGEAPENECCPTCGEHNFFSWGDLSAEGSRNMSIVVRSRMTGRELLDYVSNPDSSWEHMSCVCCNTAVDGDFRNNRVIHDPDYVHYTREQFLEALQACYNGDMEAYIRCDEPLNGIDVSEYLRTHFPEQSYAAE